MNYFLIHITYPILLIAVFARQLCLPVPAILFLLSSGALVGAGRLSFAGILLVAVVGCVSADLIWFQAGRRHGKPVLRLLSAFAPDPSYYIRKGKTVFAKRGLAVLLVAKFIPGLDGICPPLAGMLGASRVAFLAYDAGGAALWSGAYIGCGMVFGGNPDKVARYTSVFAIALILTFGVPLLFFFTWKLVQLVRMIRLLRPLQITAEMLKIRLSTGEKIGIVDLLRFEEDPEGVAAIPGAIRLDPLEVRRKERFRMPPDVGLVLYCRSKDSFVSARVALAMRKQGIRNIHVLAGGLECWKSRGYPLSSEFADPEKELQRLGIEVFPPWRCRHNSK